jgi:hypothetical protein
VIISVILTKAHTDISPVFSVKGGNPQNISFIEEVTKKQFFKKLACLLQANFLSHKNIISLVAKIV